MVLPDYKGVLDDVKTEINQRINDEQMLKDAQHDKETLEFVLEMIKEYESVEVDAAEAANS